MNWAHPGEQTGTPGDHLAYLQSMTRVYCGELWLFPGSGGNRSMHPLMAWWAVKELAAAFSVEKFWLSCPRQRKARASVVRRSTRAHFQPSKESGNNQSTWQATLQPINFGPADPPTTWPSTQPHPLWFVAGPRNNR